MCPLTVDYSWGYTMPCKEHYSYTWTKGYGIDIPIWKRYLLSVTEAAQFYHIGEKRLRQIVDIHPNGEFYLLVGNKVLFKKEKFEQFLAESTAI